MIVVLFVLPALAFFAIVVHRLRNDRYRDTRQITPGPDRATPTVWADLTADDHAVLDGRDGPPLSDWTALDDHQLNRLLRDASS